MSVAVQKPEKAVLEDATSRNLIGEATAGCVVKADESSRMETVNLEPYCNSTNFRWRYIFGNFGIDS